MGIINSNLIFSIFGNKKIYLHKNVKLKHGGRKVPKISVKEFNEILSNLKVKAINEGYEDFNNENKYAWILDDAYEMFTKLNKDLSKINFDFENHEVDIRIHITNSCIPYLRCYAGGDWEIPVRFYIYWDGKNLRGYIPTKGNTFNSKTKSALGNSIPGCFFDDKPNKSDYYLIVKEIHPELLKQYTVDEINEYMKEFDLNLVDIQDDWCLEDFEKRLEIK